MASLSILSSEGVKRAGGRPLDLSRAAFMSSTRPSLLVLTWFGGGRAVRGAVAIGDAIEQAACAWEAEAAALLDGEEGPRGQAACE